MKEGTTDLCRGCGRSIEYVQPPAEYNDEGEDLRPFYLRKPEWVDIDPPGEEIHNPWCQFEERRVRHLPLNYCITTMQTGNTCYAKVKEPATTSDGVVLRACGKHIKEEVARHEHTIQWRQQQEMSKWQQESESHWLREMSNRGLAYYPMSQYIPLQLREKGVVVDAAVIVKHFEELEMEVLYWKGQVSGNDSQSRDLATVQR